MSWCLISLCPPAPPQGKLLRKKRREKDGHKDPLLAEVSRLQEEIMVQISQLRKEQEEAEKKCVELDKVALILGLHIMDKPRKESRLSGELPSSSEGNRDSARSSNNPAVNCDAASSKVEFLQVPGSRGAAAVMLCLMTVLSCV